MILRIDRLEDVLVDLAFSTRLRANLVANDFALALELLRPKGQLVLKSTFHGKTEMDAARIVVDEIAIVGSRCGRFGGTPCAPC